MSRKLTQAELKAKGKKRCPKCGRIKDRATDFNHRADGTVFSWCKLCNRKYSQARTKARQQDQPKGSEGGR